jgi:uncharacterized membrane protein YfcA
MSWPAFEPGFYLVAAITNVLTGISKGRFGSGIAVPPLSLWISPLQAAGIMLPILCVMDLAGLLA